VGGGVEKSEGRGVEAGEEEEVLEVLQGGGDVCQRKDE
jgi:hypothetical protein